MLHEPVTVAIMQSATDELEPVLFNTTYDSMDQRRLRLAALIILLIKYALRSILQTWPLYFIAIVPFLIPDEAGWWIALFIFPALVVSGNIAFISTRQEYRKYIRGKLLLRNNLASLIWHDTDNLCQ